MTASIKRRWRVLAWLRLSGIALLWLVASEVQAQQAAAPAQPPAQPPAAQAAGPEQAAAAGNALDNALADVSTKYRFKEVYTRKDGDPLPGEIGQTLNALKEKLVMTMDVPKGPPVKSERSRQVIYTERPASLTGLSKVDAVARRFETLRFEPAPQGLHVAEKPPLDGLTIYAVRGPAGEQVVSLDDSRSITDFEHQVATTVPTLLNFAELLPQGALRIGDTWQLNRNAARLLVGRGQVSATSLQGSLESVKPSPANAAVMIAKMNIVGKVSTNLGTCDLNLQYLFEFPKAVATIEKLAAFGAKAPAQVLVAQGAIIKLSQAQIEISDIDPNGRLKQVFDRSLTYERRIGGRQKPLAVPANTPTPSKANSWLVFEDPENRFTLKHPPVFRPDMKEENSILFVTSNDPPDFIRVDMDGNGTKPEQFRKDLEAEWKAEGIQVFALQDGYLNDKAWGDCRVYRLEAALKMPGVQGNQRAHFDAYVIQYPVNQTYIAESTTWQERPGDYRDLVEEILQGIKLSTPTAKPAPADVKPDAGQPAAPAAPAAPGSPAPEAAKP